MDAYKFLTTKDTLLRGAMQAVAKETDRLAREKGEERAIQIANAVGRMLS